MKTTPACLALAVLLGAPGCKPRVETEGVSTNAPAAAANQEIRAPAQTKDEFVATMQEKLNQLDQHISEWRAKTGALTDEAKAEGNKALENLREQRAQVSKKLDELKASGKEAWKDLRAGLENAYGELEKAFDNARSKFTK